MAGIFYILVCVWHTPHIGLWLDDAVTGILHMLVCGWHTPHLVYGWTMLSLTYSKHWSVFGILHILVYSWMMLQVVWLDDAVTGILHILVCGWVLLLLAHSAYWSMVG